MNPREHVRLSAYTTLGVGGPARFLADAVTPDDVPRALEFSRARKLPLFILGGGSNVLVSDAGFPGLVLRMRLMGVKADPGGAPGRLTAGAGEEWDAFVAQCVGRGLGGVECLSGIPGTVGGTPVQNVGAYGQEVAQVIERVRVHDTVEGRTRDLDRSECGFAYRSSRFNTAERDRYVVLEVGFRLPADAAPNLEYRDVKEYFAGRASAPSLAGVRDAVREIRRRKAMLLEPGGVDSRSAGSFFKNPVLSEDSFTTLADFAGPELPRYPAPAGCVKTSAAWLIEHAGFTRGYARGRAAISSRHTLALVNLGGAGAAEILGLAREIQDRVAERFGVRLEPEPVMVGFEAK